MSINNSFDDNQTDDNYNDDNDSNTGVYTCSITPDPHFGLGLRLDIVDSRILVESYKRNPLTMKAMPAEESGIVSIGDELLGINGINLKGM